MNGSEWANVYIDMLNLWYSVQSRGTDIWSVKQTDTDCTVYEKCRKFEVRNIKIKLVPISQPQQSTIFAVNRTRKECERLGDMNSARSELSNIGCPTLPTNFAKKHHLQNIDPIMFLLKWFSPLN